MSRKSLIGAAAFIGLSFLLVSLAVAAKPQNRLAPADPANAKPSFSIPANAVSVAPGVYSLGAVEKNGKQVEGYAFVRYKNNPAKPGTGGVCGNGVCEAGENAKRCSSDCGGSADTAASSCYGYLAKGAKWKTLEPYMTDAANNQGLDSAFISANLAADIAKWEGAANYDILGGETVGFIDGADTGAPDGKNEVYFGAADDPNVIAVTVIWGIFGGAPQNRELVEWDMVFNQADFDWSASGDPAKMDFENIATHELGHAVGLSDLYVSDCSLQTMYGYAADGETGKRTLENGDMIGISKLYR